MKTCTKCHQEKELTEFYKNRSTKDGLHSYCKTCFKASTKAYHQSERGKATLRKASTQYQQTSNCKVVKANYRNSPMGKAAKERFYGRHPNYTKVKSAKDRLRYPKQIKARSAVNNLITAGRMSRPVSLQCHYCPNPAKQYHHWHGYEPEHWLDVVPACRDCHIKEDGKPCGEKVA